MTHTHRPAALEVHHPQPLAVHPTVAPLVTVQPGPTPAVQSIVLPDGRVVTGYTLTPAPALAPSTRGRPSRAQRSTSPSGASGSPQCAAGWSCSPRSSQP
ncbi:hypothetical protein SAVCW2_43360 [Streptomyces avermitilis]|nr:hypothetical protein SAVCW2_43360 [Streptomyces avermitilis]